MELSYMGYGGFVRCAKCGNDNAEENRFCGMCGAALSGKPPGTPAQTRTSAPTGIFSAGSKPTTLSPSPYLKDAVPISPPIPDAGTDSRLRSDPTSRIDDEPIITGPSFLGLNQPSSRAGLGEFRERDKPHSSSDRLAYLLEDDEEKPNGNWVKVVLVAVALALIAGLGYVRWRQGGFDWLQSGSKTSVVQPAPDSSQTSTDSASAKTTPATDSRTATPPQAGTTGNGTTGNAATGNRAAGNSTMGNNSTASPAAGSDTTSNDTAPAGGSAATPKESAQDVTDAQTSQDAASGTPLTTKPTQQISPNDTNSGADAALPRENVKAEATPASKPTPKPAAGRKTEFRRPAPKEVTRPFLLDSVAESERYLYGRGVSQDCDRGLRLLKPAAAQANPAAMISMGTLYSTGTCTPRDLPTAYRWYALALHKEPNNEPLQADLQKLWSRMTQPERQLAIKLSQ